MFLQASMHVCFATHVLSIRRGRSDPRSPGVFRDKAGHICMVRGMGRALEKSRHLRDAVEVDNVDNLLPGPSETQLGRLLHELRCMQGLATEQLARRSGLETSVIDALEHGQHGADVATLRQVATGLGIRVGVIFTLWEQRSLSDDK
jgi:hypothetical protein